MPDITSFLEQAVPRELEVQVCLAGDAASDVDALQAELDALAGWQPTSMGDVSPAREILGRLEAAQQRFRDATFTFRFKALGHISYNALIAAHPPASPHGPPYDPATFLPALLVACCAEPTLTGQQVTMLLERVNDGTAQALFAAAIAVNEEITPVPF